MPKEINPWAMYPRKTSTASLPEALKLEVTSRANELIETVLKLKYIQPPPPLPLQSSTRWGVVMLPGRSKGAFLVGRGESCPFPATSSFEGQACKIASH